MLEQSPLARESLKWVCNKVRIYQTGSKKILVHVYTFQCSQFILQSQRHHVLLREWKTRQLPKDSMSNSLAPSTTLESTR